MSSLGPPAAGGHLRSEVVADLAEGLLPPDAARAAQAHLQACGRCAGLRADLAGLQARLGDLPHPGPMPADVVGRVEAALGREREALGQLHPGPQRQPQPVPARQHPAGVARPPRPTRPARPPRPSRPARPARPSSPSWRPRLLGAAAAGVIAVTLGAIAVPALRGGDEAGGGSRGEQEAASAPVEPGSAQPGQDAEQAPPVVSGAPQQEAAAGGRSEAARPVTPLLASGTAYTRQTLPALVRGLLGRASSGAGDAAASATPAPELLNCARRLDPERRSDPLAVDAAAFEGRPAVVVVVADEQDPGFLDVFVVEPDCPAGEVLHFARVAR